MSKLFQYAKRAAAITGLFLTTHCGDAPFPDFVPGCSDGHRIEIVSPHGAIPEKTADDVSQRLSQLPDSLCNLVDRVEFVDENLPLEVKPSNYGELAMLRWIPSNHYLDQFNYTLDGANKVLRIDEDVLFQKEDKFTHPDTLHQIILLGLARGVPQRVRTEIAKDLLGEELEPFLTGYVEDEVDKYLPVVVAAYVTDPTLPFLIRDPDQVLNRLRERVSERDFKVLERKYKEAVNDRTIKLYESVSGRIFGGDEYNLSDEWQDVAQAHVDFLVKNVSVDHREDKSLAALSPAPEEFDAIYGALLRQTDDPKIRNYLYGILLRTKLEESRARQVYVGALGEDMDVPIVRGLKYISEHFEFERTPLIDPTLADIADGLTELSNQVFLHQVKVQNGDKSELVTDPLTVGDEILANLADAINANFYEASQAPPSSKGAYFARNDMVLRFASLHQIPVKDYVCMMRVPRWTQEFDFCN